MSLWVDKHRPSNLSKLDYHQEQAAYLKKLVHGGDFPHLLVYGPSGAGKKTRIMCVLRELYGAGVERLRIEHQNFVTPSKKKIEIVTVASNYHIEVNPSEAGIHDRVVVQELLKTVAQTQQLESSAQREFKVVILTEVDKLTKDAQHALRRTMEKYMATCRLILCCNSCSKVIPAIRSRCLAIRVAAPSVDEVQLHLQQSVKPDSHTWDYFMLRNWLQGDYMVITVLNLVARREGITLPDTLARAIAAQSHRNLRRAVLMLEACRAQQYPFSDNQKVRQPDWELYLEETAKMIVQEQSVKRLSEVRARLYELLTHLIPPDVILKGLLKQVVANCDGQLKGEATALAAQYEHRLQLGSKAIYHLEAFVAKVMAIYKNFLDESISGFF